MTRAQFLGVVEQYKQQIKNLGYPAHAAETSTRYYPGLGQSLMHAQWMLDQMTTWTEIEPQKANRWLGFVQGIMWQVGIYSIDEMREHIRMRRPA